MANVVTPQHLEPGALWTFVKASGELVEYVFDRVMAPAVASTDHRIPGFTAMVALTNFATEKQAMVSEKWLREGPVSGGAHWLPKAEAPAMAEAA